MPETGPNHPRRYIGTGTHCHCGANKWGSDHCPYCGCEEWESGCDTAQPFYISDEPSHCYIIEAVTDDLGWVVKVDGNRVVSYPGPDGCFWAAIKANELRTELSA